MLKREEAKNILFELTETETLRRHARTVELVMEAYAKKLDENVEEWAIAGMLHDADYEKFPDEHPKIIVEKLRGLGEEKIAHAISAHYTKWKIPYETLLDKGLLACDELTGFIVACSLVRPEKLEGLKAKSVKKKLKNKKFAAKVEREEVFQGAEIFGVDLGEHIDFIVNVLYANREELGLT
ncbi:MAG: HD domain-containing protein [Calditrichaeota bacterium]|nr:MAG: HD domain-containing protein [Calditrichota bacterium]